MPMENQRHTNSYTFTNPETGQPVTVRRDGGGTVTVIQASLTPSDQANTKTVDGSGLGGTVPGSFRPIWRDRASNNLKRKREELLRQAAGNPQTAGEVPNFTPSGAIAYAGTITTNNDSSEG